MAKIHAIVVTPPLLNSSSAWASELHQLQQLYDSPYTGAVTIRTATLNGFPEDDSHTVVFTNEAQSHGLCSLNSYGYSPHPLSTYLAWIESILTTSPPPPSSPSKPFIISITSSSPPDLRTMLASIQSLRSKLPGSSSRIAIELNTSCPNIPGYPPPAYNLPSLLPLLEVLAEEYTKDETLTLGLKLPPYVYEGQFLEVIKGVGGFSFGGEKRKNPFAFFTCTNTLGTSLLFADQTTTSPPTSTPYALPNALGGLAGEPIHALSLGNVHTFNRLLRSSLDPALQQIVIVGVGGVTSREAVRRMTEVGASVVGCATAFGKEGVAVFERLSREEGV